MARAAIDLYAGLVQIRGPGLLGPRIQIRGPGLRVAGAVTDPDLTAQFQQAVADDEGPVSILMADSEVDIQRLTARWPLPLLSPGWLVGVQTNEAELTQAYALTGDGAALRILIAGTFNDVIALADEW